MSKGLLLILISLLIHSFLFSQVEEKPQLIGEVTMELNSSILGALLKPRDVVKIDLPPNTKSWFYQFRTNLNEKNTSIFKTLSSTVQQAAVRASAYYTAGASTALLPLLSNVNIPIPTGEAEVSIYCLDESNKSAFLKKDSFSPFDYGIAENQKEGRILIPNAIDKSLYIGIKNTSSMQRRVYVNLQIYAIVEKPRAENSSKDKNGWSFENKNKMFNRWYNEAKKLGYNELNCLQIARCTQTTILSTYSINDYKSMGNTVWNDRVSVFFKNCLAQAK